MSEPSSSELFAKLSQQDKQALFSAKRNVAEAIVNSNKFPAGFLIELVQAKPADHGFDNFGNPV